MICLRPLLLVFVIIILTTAGCIGPEQPGDTQYPMTEMTVSPGSEEESSVLIRISFDDHEVIAELYDNAAANDLRSMLPLTLIFRDYNGAEKIAYPPETLDTENAPKGYDPEEDTIRKREMLHCMLPGETLQSSTVIPRMPPGLFPSDMLYPVWKVLPQ